MNVATSAAAPWWATPLIGFLGVLVGQWMSGHREARARKHATLDRALNDIIGVTGRIIEWRLRTPSPGGLGEPGDQAAFMAAKDSITMVAEDETRTAADVLMFAIADMWAPSMPAPRWAQVTIRAKDELIVSVRSEMRKPRQKAIDALKKAVKCGRDPKKDHQPAAGESDAS